MQFYPIKWISFGSLKNHPSLTSQKEVKMLAKTVREILKKRLSRRLKKNASK